MKKMFLIAALVVAAACGRKNPVEPKPVREALSPTFTDAAMVYYGSLFELALTADDEAMKFYLAAERVEDAFQAALAAGTYVFSRRGGQFTLLPSSYYVGGTGTLSKNIADGSLSLESDGGKFTVRFDVSLSDGQTVEGEYNGAIVNLVTRSDLDADLALDFSTMGDGTDGTDGAAHAQAEPDAIIPGLWQVELRGEDPDADEEWTAQLHIYAPQGIQPGEYPLVPTYMTGGTLNVWPSGSLVKERLAKREIYVAPGGGAVKLALVGEVWTVAFSFATYEGYAVGGTFEGALDIL